MSDNGQFLKGILSTIILKLLNDNEKMYGYEMTKKVKDLTNGNIQLTEGALYPALHKLEADGLIYSSIELFGNRPRKYYHLTRTGKKEVRIKLADMISFINDLKIILNLNPNVSFHG